MTFGAYSKPLDVSYITQKRGASSSASPEIELIRYARFICMSEPGPNDGAINIGKLKQMTGGDKMTSRGLFKNTTQFKPQFKITLMCNDKPEINGQDEGTWRRVEVVDFISKFKNNPTPTPQNPHIYQMDDQLVKKLENWKILFATLLFNKYRDYNQPKELGGGTNPPLSVINSSQEYRCSNDSIAMWIKDALDISDTPTPFKDLKTKFNDWYDDEGYNSKNKPQQKELKDYLMKWQDKSKWGLSLGDKNSPNGSKSRPKFNLKPIDEE